MRKIIFILSVISFGISAAAQESYLSREAYRDKVEAYSQLLKQQRLKATASTEARKIAQTGFLPKIDITAEGTANLSHLDAWNSPAGQYRPYTYQALATLGQPLYTGGSLMARKKIAKADEELDKLATELTLDQIHYQSDAVYWNASAALATLEAAARFEGIVSQQYNIIQDRFNDGAISRTDLLMISTRKKEAELQYIKARQNYTLALQQLNILMGVKPDAAVDSLCEIGMHCPPVDLLSLDEVCPAAQTMPEPMSVSPGAKRNARQPSASIIPNSVCSWQPVGTPVSPIWDKTCPIRPLRESTSTSPFSDGVHASRPTASKRHI